MKFNDNYRIVEGTLISKTAAGSLSGLIYIWNVDYNILNLECNRVHVI
jgi:hypothetical protein